MENNVGANAIKRCTCERHEAGRNYREMDGDLIVATGVSGVTEIVRVAH